MSLSRRFRHIRPLRLLALALVAATTAPGVAAASPVHILYAPSTVSFSHDGLEQSPGELQTITATATDANGELVPDGTVVTFTLSGPAGVVAVGEPVVGIAMANGPMAPVPPGGQPMQPPFGGWLARVDGTVSSFGTTPAVTPPAPVGSPVIEIASTPSGAGYWVTTAAGHVLRAGDAMTFGDLGNVALNGPILAMAPTASGRGYYLVGSDGGVFAFGDAQFFGSTGAMKLPRPVMGIMATATGRGYWLYADDGAVYPFGDAVDHGDMRARGPLPKPVVDGVRTATGRGYWLVSSDGAIYSFGDATFQGSLGNVRLGAPAVRIAGSASGRGYVVAMKDGRVIPFGDAPDSGTVGGYPVRTAGGRATLAFSSLTAGETVVGASMTSPVSATAVPLTFRWVGSGPVPTVINQSEKSGYWMLGSGGAVYAFGDAPNHGQPVLAAGVEAVDLEPTPGSGGYWIVDSNGVVYAFGDARHFGNLDRARLSNGERITSLSATPDGSGYWIFTTRGRVLAFGDARHFGDVAAVALNGPVLDSIPTPSGLGYYMVASDGGIFAFGDAEFAGSMGGQRLNKPVQSLVPDADGAGYWLVASDGGIFAFDSPFRGSLGSVRLNKPIKGMVRYGNGYLMVGTDGGIFAFSDKPFAGSLGANPPAHPIVSVAAAR